MVKKAVWFELVDGRTTNVFTGTSANAVDLAEDAQVYEIQKAVVDRFSCVLPLRVVTTSLRVYANRATYDRNQVLEPHTSIGTLGEQEPLIVEVPQRCRVGISAQVQEKNLLHQLEWQEPKRLCLGSGQNWPASAVKDIKDPLVKHYQAWKEGCEDKQHHAILLVASGQGTGKSRMLDEMKNLLCQAAEQSMDQEFIKRMENAYVFNMTFGDHTAAIHSLRVPEYEISYRMLYQLSKEKPGWSTFRYELERSYSNLPLTIGSVIALLAKLEKINHMKDMTVVLCVDGLQKLVYDDTKTCGFYRVLTSIYSFLNSSIAFAVCVCSSTVQGPIRQAFVDSPQMHQFLLPPLLDGHKILTTRTRIAKQLVDDMGGHGRGLEVLERVLNRHKDSLDLIDPADIVDKEYRKFESLGGDIWCSLLFCDEANIKAVVAAILSRRKYGLLERIGHTDLTVDEIRSMWLFRWTHEERLECAFILFVNLTRIWPTTCEDDFNSHLTRSELVWQRFEQIVALHRRMKAVAYCETSVALSEFHVGKKQVQCNEVMRCKLLQTDEKIDEELTSKNAKTPDSDVLILITLAEATTFDLPPRCGLVSKNEFEQYFGPFASRAYRSLLEPLDINTASYHQVEGVGDANANKVIEKRPYSNLEDAVNRLGFNNKKCKTAEILL
ncbi:LOW QUALITY PROTEIN: Crinkler (CRN) domain containing hypothetical protein, partial [Phytophthora palmivora]